MSTNLGDLVAGQPEARKAREFAGFKARLIYSSPNGLHLQTEVRYAKADAESVFDVGDVKKVGPNNGSIRWSKGEWKAYEKQPDGSEVEITPDSIRYLQTVDGQEVEVEPFDGTKTWDVREDRPLEECTLDGATALGSVIPREKVEEFGPDKDTGSSLYEVWGDDQALRALAEKLEKERLALYFPHVFRKGMTIHLAVGYIVRINGSIYLILRTVAGPVIHKKPIREDLAVKTEERQPLLVKPVLRRKPIGVH